MDPAVLGLDVVRDPDFEEPLVATQMGDAEVFPEVSFGIHDLHAYAAGSLFEFE